MDVSGYLPLLPYWEKLTDDEKKYAERNVSLRDYKKGALLHGSGDSCLGMVYVVSGSIRVYILSDEGREVTLFRLEKGDCCMLSASCVISQITFETIMTAERDTELAVLNPDAFKKLSDNNVNVRCFMYELAAERFSTVVWVFQRILFEKLDRRLSGFLLDECGRRGKKELKITQEQIAVEINSAREVVARMLGQFASDGLVELKRGSVTVLDAEKMKKMI